MTLIGPRETRCDVREKEMDLPPRNEGIQDHKAKMAALVDLVRHSQENLSEHEFKRRRQLLWQEELNMVRRAYEGKEKGEEWIALMNYIEDVYSPKLLRYLTDLDQHGILQAQEKPEDTLQDFFLFKLVTLEPRTVHTLKGWEGRSSLQTRLFQAFTSFYYDKLKAKTEKVSPLEDDLNKNPVWELLSKKHRKFCKRLMARHDDTKRYVPRIHGPKSKKEGKPSELVILDNAEPIQLTDKNGVAFDNPAIYKRPNRREDDLGPLTHDAENKDQVVYRHYGPDITITKSEWEKARNELKPRDKNILDLDLQEKSDAEIATTLNINITSVQKTKGRAKSALIKALLRQAKNPEEKKNMSLLIIQKQLRKSEHGSQRNPKS